MKSGAFAAYHPIANFTYFTFVIAFAMFFTHPLCLALSFICPLAWAIRLNGVKALKWSVRFLLPMMLLAAVLNPLFSHAGATILAYLPSGNPLTLESVVFGFAAAFMLGAVILWFSCFNAVMTSDKFICLFGRVIPSLSLVLSMVLRFVPRFREQLRIISRAQRCLGRGACEGGAFKRLKNGLRILSIMVTWSLESSIETADSMKSRGYGLSGRTAFSIYRFERRDALALAAAAGLGVYIAAGALAGGMAWQYFPYIRGGRLSLYSASVFAAYAGLCALPLFIDLREDRKWKLIRSNI